MRAQSVSQDTVELCDLDIRPATPDDAEVIYNFIVELATYEKEPDAVETTPNVIARQMAETPPPFECLLADFEGQSLGFALFFHNYSTWRGKKGLYIEDIYVSPAHRGKGIGKALFFALKRIAVERDCGRMEWAVLNWNTPAIEFYRSHGATALDDWTIFRLRSEELQQTGKMSRKSARASTDAP